MFNKILASSGGQTKHLMAGLEKLSQAKTMVDQLSQEASQQKILLSQKEKEAKAAMVEITKSLE